MAVGYDTSAETTFTTTAPFTVGYTPGVAAQGILVGIAHPTATDLIDGTIDYGGEELEYVGTTSDGAGEPGRVYLYLLGSNVPTGTQTLTINHTGSSDVKWVSIASLTASGDIEAGTGGWRNQNDTNPAILMFKQTSGMAFGIAFSGLDAVASITPTAGMSAVQDHDFGTVVARMDRETTPSTGTFSFGYTAGSDDSAIVVVNLIEKASGVRALGAASTESTNNGTSLVLQPAGSTIDRIMIVNATSRDHTSGTALATCTDNSGVGSWTQFSPDTDRKANGWWKLGTVADLGAQITVAGAVGSVSGGVSYVADSYIGGDPITNASVETNASADETHAGFTPDFADSLVMFAVGDYGNDTNAVTVLAAATLGSLEPELFERLSSAGNDCRTTVTAKTSPGGPTATGNFTWTQGDSTTKSFAWALKPPPTPSTETVDHTTDALLVNRVTKTHTTDALLKKTATKTHTTDALLTTGATKTQTADAVLKKTSTKVHTTDALLTAVGTATTTHTSDAILVGRGERLDLVEVQSNVNSDSTSVDIPDTTTCALLAVSGLGGSANFFSGGTVTIGGQSMTLQTSANSSATLSGVAIWTLFFPPTGSQTLAWNWSGSSAPSAGAQLYLASYAGVLGVRSVSTAGQGAFNEIVLNSSAIGFIQDDIQVAVGAGNGGSSTWTGMTEEAGSTYNGNLGSFAENINPSQENVLSTSRLWNNGGTSIAIAGVLLSTEPGFVYGKVRAFTSAIESNGTTGFTMTIPTVQVNDVLVVAAVNQTMSTVTCTDNDSGGNTWTEIDQGFDQHSWLFMKRATSATSGKTVTIAGATHSTTGGLIAFYDVSDDDANLFDGFDNVGHLSGDEDTPGFTPLDEGESMNFIVFNYIGTGGTGNFGLHDSSPGTMQPPQVNRSSTGTGDCRVTWGAWPQRRSPVEATGDFAWTQTNNNTQTMIFGLRPRAHAQVVQTVHTTDAILVVRSEYHTTDVLVFDPNVDLTSTTFTLELMVNGQPTLATVPPIENEGPPGGDALPNQGPTGAGTARAGGYALKNYRKPTTRIIRRD